MMMMMMMIIIIIIVTIVEKIEAENEVRKIHHQILVMRKMKNVGVADVGIDHLEVRVVVDQKIEGNVKEKMMKVSLDLCCERW